MQLSLPSAAKPGERPYVSGLEFDVQAKLPRGKSYQPLVDVRGLPCWPSEPDWKQLVGGEGLKKENRLFESHWDQRKEETKVLQVGQDFDLVVLAVGVGAVPYTCRELLAYDERWRDMVREIKSVPTQALQLWLRESIEQLGWRLPSINISGYVEPFDTWADMPQLIEQETFPRKVKAVAYFRSVLPDGSPAEQKRADYPELRAREVRANANRISGTGPRGIVAQRRWQRRPLSLGLARRP